MNDLLLAPELFAHEGGIARILRLYLRALCANAASGDKVRFVSLNDASMEPARLEALGAGVLAGWRLCGASRIRFVLQSTLLGLRSDRIICGHVAQLPVAWLVSRIRPGLKYYLVAHGIEVWRPFSRIEGWSLRGATGIFCVSDYTRRRLLEHCPLPEGRVSVVYNALDPDLEAAERSETPADPPAILAVSRLSRADDYKGLDHLIEAMPAVIRTVPSARLRIIGTGDAVDGLRALAQAEGVAGNVDFLGYVNDRDLGLELSRCRLFALPSQKEGFGLVYLEAMARGRPCLGARAGGVPEVITEDTGVLVDYGDVPAISAAILSSLARKWPPGPFEERVRTFSFGRFKERLADALREPVAV